MEAHGLNWHHLRRLRTQSSSRLFLTFHPTHLEYRSLEAVCRSLAVLPGRSVYLPTESIQSTESFRAALYTGWIAGQESGVMISRERLSALFGISADTQRRWERLTGVEVVPTVVEVSKGDLEAAEPHIPRDKRLDGDRLGRSYVWEYQGSFYYQSVNRYGAPHQDAPSYVRGAVGNVRKVSRAVRTVAQCAVAECNVLPVEFHGDGTRRRIFYTERTTPANHQEQTGCSLRGQGRPVDVPHGLSDLWQFSRTKPVARREVFC